MKIGTKMFSSLNYRSIILGIIIFASILAFLFTGFGRFQVFNFKKMDPNTALIVGNQKVDMMEFSNILTGQGFSNSLPDNQKKYLANQILNQLVDQKLLIEIAEQLNFVASDASIAAFLRSISIFQDPQTGNFSYDYVKKFIHSQNIDEVEFFQKVKNEVSVQNITRLIDMPDAYPKTLAKDDYIIQNTEFMLNYALLNINSVALAEKAQSQVTQFINDPENETELQAAYDAKKAQFNQSAKYEVRSILIAYKDATRAQGDALNRSKESAKKLARNILDHIQEGTPFSKAASQINDDIAAKKNKGLLGYIDETAIDAQSFVAIAQLTVNKPLSDIVDTSFGFRIFKLENKRAAEITSFADAKQILAKDILIEKLHKTAQTDFDNKVREFLKNSADATALNQFLTEQNIQWQSLKTPYTIQQESLADFGSSEQLVKHVFGLKKSGDLIPEILDFGSEKHVLIKLISRRKPDEPSLVVINSLQQKTSKEDGQKLLKVILQNMRESYEKKGKIKMNPELI